MEYKESILSKHLPTLFKHKNFRVCDINILPPSLECYDFLICIILTFDLIQKRFRCFISTVKPHHDEKEKLIKCIEEGGELPHRLSAVIFKDYFMKEEMIVMLDKDLKLFLKLLEILEEK